MTTQALAGAILQAQPTDPLVRRTAQLAILDCLGVGLAGSHEPASLLARKIACPEGTATVWGSDMRSSVLDAALINGVSGHVLDMDDTNSSMRGHPTVTLVPALIAVAEARSLPGEAVVDAFIVGFETGCKLGQVMNLEHYERGWHSSSTLGTVGVAAAVGRLIGLDTERLTHALAISCSFSSGLVRNFGSMTKSLHIGHAARSGTLAALLAEQGFTGHPEVMEYESGFLEIFSAAAAPQLQEVVNRFGQPWDVVDPGILFKLYPSCSLTHPALDAALDLQREHDFAADDIVRITCHANYRVPMVLTYTEPADELQAKFSMEYALAVAFLDGQAGIDQFSRDRVGQADVQTLLRRVDKHIHPDLSTRESLTRDFTHIEVELGDGRVLEARAGHARASPGNPVDDSVLVDKFVTCAARVLPAEAAAAIPAIVLELDRQPDLGRLSGLISRA